MNTSSQLRSFLLSRTICVIAAVFFSSAIYAQSAGTNVPDSKNNPLLTLDVIDSFVEVRTGPGRGYPVFYVIEQGESVDVLTRRAGWYEVRAVSGKVGWATSRQLSRTLQASGEPADLPSVSFGDYQKNKWRVGFTSGEFFSGELDGAALFSATMSYRFYGWLSLEAELGKIINSEIEGDFYNANILIEPFSKWRLSPELIIGTGELGVDNQPKQTAFKIEDSSFTNYGLGLNYYLGRNFVIRGEYRRYSVSADDNLTLDSWKIGFNTFF